MTQEATQSWHRNPADIAEKMTVRLGAPFSELCLWATARGLEFPLELSYHILGLDEFTVSIGNLVQELTQPESKTITAEWSENPIVNELKNFVEVFAADDKVSRKYARIGHRGSVSKTKRLFRNVSTRTFLLVMITIPLADSANKRTFCYRRRLRIWLIIQAASRLLDYRCSADASISIAARFLQIDSLDNRWKLIDELLDRTGQLLGPLPNSFENFTSALENAAGMMKQIGHCQKTPRGFLNAIVLIAGGSCREIESRSINTRIPPHLKTTLSPIDEMPFETEESIFNVIPSISDEDEGAEFSYITEVDPTDSVAQQTLSSGSVFIQTMELSHYLPWSWDRLLPPEVRLIESWIEDQLYSLERTEKLGGTLVWIAIQLSRSLPLVERITIESEVTDEWSLSPDFEFLKRSSPRRHSAWRPNESNFDQVAPFRDDLTIIVPDTITRALKSVIGPADSTPATLGAMWQGQSKTKLENWFNEQARAHFPRVSSAKLAHCKSQQLFDLTGDFNFSRLLTSHPKSALPGACSYATWDVKAIEKGLQMPVPTFPGESDNIHLMGSLLAPIESVLCKEIQRANEKLEQAHSKGLIHYHNALTQYVVMALYASTGARPLRDPFESSRHFSSTFQCVYINDKNDEGLHNGRVAPLPKRVVDLLSHYLGHLNNVSQQLIEHRGNLAQHILQTTRGHSDNLPFFFLLDENLHWHSLADAATLSCQLFEWTLPTNLFRHRYSQRLLQEGVEPEVIEGWMGHAERGSASYSDYSARCWADDANIYRDTLERVFNSLPFSVPADDQKLPVLLYLAPAQTTYVEPEIFGQRARARQRKLKLKTAIQQTHADIQLFLNGRQFDDISDGDLVRLSHRMLLRENRLPHPQAALRFRIFTKVIKHSIAEVEPEPQRDNPEKKGKESGERPITSSAKREILKKRLINVSDERSLVSPNITAALETFSHLSSWAERIKKSALKASLSKSRALCVGAALLSIEKRLGYQKLLLDVVKGEHFRLIQHKRQYFFEYSEALNPDDFSEAVQRHEVSYKVASLLAHGVNMKKEVGMPPPGTIDELKEVLEIYSCGGPKLDDPSMADLLSWMCHIINQANLIQLPGIVAAALSERSPPTSSSLRDYVRILHGRATDVPGHTPQGNGLPPQSLARPRNQETNKRQLQENAKVFTRAITELLNSYSEPKAREYADKIQSVCQIFQGTVSSSMLLAGYWIADRARLGKGKKWKKLEPLARRSLTTYWSSISSPFRGFLYDVDLVNLDSDEVTDFCAEMLDYKAQTSRHIDYFGKRLKDFFRWATQFGVVAPEWDELDVSSGYRSVSPGLITEAEYQASQAFIQSDNSLSVNDKTTLGFVLLLTYRFGLRAKEAIALLFRDWCQDEQFSWVLVQNSRYRRLKSKASRRAVPLLFDFSETEREIVDQAVAHYKSIAWPEVNRPILCETSIDGTPTLTSLAPRISEALIRVLRHVTGNPQLVLHHCRHSFYNRLAPALFDLKSPLATKLSDALEHPHLRQAILGQTHNVSRRSAMALARLMGHRFPSTGLKHYCHLVTDWIDFLTPVTHQRARRISGITQVSELPDMPKAPHTEMSDALEYPAPSLAALLKALRLVGQGLTYERAGALMKIHPRNFSLLRLTIEKTNARMRFSSPGDKNIKIKGSGCPNAFLESISDDAWHRLIHHANTLGDAEMSPAINDSVKYLEELPYLTSPNRQLLMDQPAHSLLVKRVLQLYEIPPTQYQVIAKGGRQNAMEKMQDAGFDVLPEPSIRTKVDGFPIFMSDRNSESRIEDYGALLFSRAREGVIRNSFELAVAFLAVGVLVQIAVAKKSSIISSQKDI